jgi:hypothetical protein
MTKAELQYLLIQRQKPKSGTKDELVQRLQALCKTHGDQAHYALQVAAKNLTMMEQALKSEWALYHMSGNESWFHLLCDNCFACGHAEILSILPNLSRHVIACYGFYVAGGKVFRFPNLPPMANTPIENFRSGS